MADDAVDVLLAGLPTIAVQGFGPDFRIDFWNDTSTQLYGWRRDEALGVRLEELLLQPQDRAVYIETVQAFVAGRLEAPAPVALEVRHRDGRTVPALCCLALRRRADGTAQVFCIDIDLGPQHRAIAMLKASEERLRTLADLSADWYWETDPEHRYTAIHGQPASGPDDPHRYLGKRRWEIDDGGRSADDWAGHRAQLERRQPFRNYELRRLDSQGRERNYIVSGQPRFDGHGHFLGYLGVGRDLTELHEARRERERLQAQLRENHKLEALGTLAGGVAHDFNNLLGALLGTLKMAREDAALGLPVEPHLSQLERTGQRARELVQRILSHTRRAAVSTTVVAVQPLMLEAIGLLRATLPAQVRIEPRMAHDPLLAELDAGQWQRVLVNLGINAWQAFGDKAGTIEFGCAADTAADGRATVRLWVRDDGCGMDEETRRRAFEPFFTTKAPGVGTGLGLALVHGVVNDHGGRIDLESAPGRGTTVTMQLPLVEGRPAAVAAEDPPTPRCELLHGRRVLLVDDDEVVRLVATALLQRAGSEVAAPGGPQEALDMLAAEPGRWDVLVTDLHMPGLDGLELAHRAGELAPGLPLVLVSGNLADAARARALGLGVRALVHKERIAEELIPAVSRVLGA
jgi:signal transduction histidine kinase